LLLIDYSIANINTRHKGKSSIKYIEMMLLATVSHYN